MGWATVAIVFRRGNGRIWTDGRGRVEGIGGADEDRTHDLLNAIQALSQLSYGPT
jgi:hypothetical protein